MTIRNETYKQCTIRVEQDDHPSDPRDWDNLGEMVCWHREYKLGDDQPAEDPQEWFANHEREAAVILPLYLFDHSGLAMSVGPFACPWDSGQVGYIWASRERALKEYGKKILTKKLKSQLAGYLSNEVKTYDDYLQGNVYGYIVESPDGETIDSCWGYFGSDADEDGYMIREAKSFVDYWRNGRAKALRRQRQARREAKHLAEQLEEQSRLLMIGL